MNFATKNMGELLLDFFSRQSNPFKQLASNKSILEIKYQDIVNIAVFGYQAWFFLNVIKNSLDEQQYNETREQIAGFMTSDPRGNDFFETTISLIDVAIEMGQLEVNEQDYTIPVPLEMNVALCILLCLPGSPHYAPQQQSRESEIHTMAEDVDQKLAAYLSRGKTRIIEWLAPLIGTDLRLDTNYSKLTLPSR